jgi:hypothetical protein
MRVLEPWRRAETGAPTTGRSWWPVGKVGIRRHEVGIELVGIWGHVDSGDFGDETPPRSAFDLRHEIKRVNVGNRPRVAGVQKLEQVKSPCTSTAGYP